MPYSNPAMVRMYNRIRRFGARRAWQATAVALAPALGLLILVGAALLDSRRDAWERASEASANLTRALERVLVAEVDAIDTALRAVAEIMHRAMVEGNAPDYKRDIVPGRLSSARYLDAILLIDEGGEVTFDTRLQGPFAANLSDRDYFSVHRQNDNAGFFISKPFRSRLADGLWSIGFSRRLSHADGSFAGAVVGIIRLKQFESAFSGMQLGSQGSITLLRDDGVVLTRSPLDDSQLGRDLGQAPAFRQSQLTASGQFVANSVIDGIPRFYSFRNFEDAPLSVNVALAVKDIYAPWWRKAMVIGGVSLLLTAALCAMVIVLFGELRRRRALEIAAHNSEERFRLLAENSSDIVSRLDADFHRLYISPAAESVFGEPAHELIGRSALESVLPDDLGVLQEALLSLRMGARDARVVYRVLRHDGVVIWLECSARLIRDKQTGEIDSIVAIARDITERKAAEEALESLAHTDGLTGLANRRAFDERFAVEWRRAQRDGTSLSLLMLDMDRFKQFNDTYGHPEGDLCLRKAAAAISGATRSPGDFTARYGGEEIVVLLPDTTLDSAEAVAEKIRGAVEALSIPHAGNHPFGVVTASLGLSCVAPLPDATAGPEILIDAADEALYRAKQSGRNQTASSFLASAETLNVQQEV